MTADTFFSNFFDNPKITDFRFRNFMRDTRSRFLAANADNSRQPAIDLIDTVLPDLDRELGEVEATGNLGMGKTMNTDSVLLHFSHAMSEEAPFIQRALKNEEPGAYLEFYPNGLSEYNRITKEDAPMLLKRVNLAAVKYAIQLGKTLSDELAAFEQQYHDAREAQTGNTGALAQNRGERSAARKAAEPVMLGIMHDTGRQHPGDVAAGERFYDLSLLYAPVHGNPAPPAAKA
jgi:hypothetical protein